MSQTYQNKYLKYKAKYLLLKEQLNLLKQAGSGFNHKTLKNDIEKLNLTSVKVNSVKSLNSLFINFEKSNYQLKIENNEDKFIGTLYLISKDETPVNNVAGLSSSDGLKFKGNKQALLNKIIELNNLLQKQTVSEASGQKERQKKSSSSNIFFEKQEGLGCGRHALNNLLQMRKFVRPSINPEKYTKEILIQLASDNSKQINLDSFCKYFHSIKQTIRESSPDVTNYCRADEYYEIEVLMNVLRLLHYDHRNYDMRTGISLKDSPNIFGYIININDGYHWISIKKNGSSYIYCDSRSDPINFDSLSELNLYLRSYNNFDGSSERITAIKEIFTYDSDINFDFNVSVNDNKSVIDNTNTFGSMKMFMTNLYAENQNIINMIKSAECTKDLSDLNKYDKDIVIGIYMSIVPEKQPKKLIELLPLLKKSL